MVLTNTLADDFGGDDMLRPGRVLHADGTVWKSREELDGKDWFDVARSPLVIVSRWEMVGTQFTSPTEARITVRYRVVATTEGMGSARRIVTLAQPREEVVTYCLWLRDGEWKLVDPPMPRVGFWAALDALAYEVKASMSRPADSKETLTYYRRELAKMETLAPKLAEKPDEFLSNILATDFAGRSTPRRHNVFYTDGKIMVGAEEGGCDCGGEPRENFYPDGAPLIVVSRWQVIATRMENPAKARVTVRYQVLATAQGQSSDRKILPLPAPRDEEVTYRVWRRHGKWLWVDPPDLPYVGYDAVLAAVRDETASLTEDVQKFPNIRELPERARLYQEQLTTLEALEGRATP